MYASALCRSVSVCVKVFADCAHSFSANLNLQPVPKWVVYVILIKSITGFGSTLTKNSPINASR